MENRIQQSVVTFIAVAGLTALAVGCATNKAGKEGKEETPARVSLAELTAPARAVVEKLTADGKVETMEKETEKGKEVYDVEATVNGKHMEYTITTDGAVIGAETGINFSELPEAVQTAATKYFGGTAGLEPARVEEDGVTAYEIEGKKAGKKVAVTFDATGKLASEEK